MRKSRTDIVSSLNGLLKPATASPTATAAGQGGTADASVPDEGDRPAADAILAVFGDLLASLSPGPGGPAQALVAVLLDVDDKSVRDMVESHLETTGTIEDPALGAQLVNASLRRHVRTWPKWLGLLGPGVAAADQLNGPLDALVSKLWERASAKKDRPTADQLVAAGAALLAVLEHRESDQWPSVADAVCDSLDEPAADDDSAARRTSIHEAARPLLAAGLLAPGVLAGREASDLTATCRLELPAQAADSELVRYVARSAMAAVAGWPNVRAESQRTTACTAVGAQGADGGP